MKQEQKERFSESAKVKKWPGNCCLCLSFFFFAGLRPATASGARFQERTKTRMFLDRTFGPRNTFSCMTCGMSVKKVSFLQLLCCAPIFGAQIFPMHKFSHVAC